MKALKSNYNQTVLIYINSKFLVLKGIDIFDMIYSQMMQAMLNTFNHHHRGFSWFCVEWVGSGNGDEALS